MAGNKMATIQLQHLTLIKLVDAAYWCGVDKQPVFIHIAGEPGIGKTYATQSLEDEHGVTYFMASFSPNEYKEHIKKIAPSTILFIHDDVGRGNPSYTKDFISAFCDITEGHMEFRQFKKNFCADFNFSAVFTSTTAWFYSWKYTLDEMGYIDRVLSLQLDLHPTTKKAYQLSCIDAAIEESDGRPKPRKITKIEKHNVLELGSRTDVAPRNLRNLLRLSRYLTIDEFDELITIVRSNKPKYSI